jgi:tetratricopeptide (TPR) repeat protein
MIFYNGGVSKRETLYEVFEDLAPAYGDDWWLLGVRAFAHHDVGLIEEARGLADRSLALRRNNGGSAHAMAHVHYETGEGAQGATFLSEWFSAFPVPGGFHTHLSWHQALFELGAGHHERALAIYADAIAPGGPNRGAALGAVADSASFLWRCRLYGSTEAALPWAAVAELCTASFPKVGTAWVDVHRGMTLSALSDDDGISALLGSLREAAKRGHTTAGSLVAPVIEAMQCFAYGQYAEAVAGLEALHDQLVALGGSNAQRDVFEETLAEAYLRAGQFDQAEAFVRERLGRRTTARDLFRLGRAQRARGEEEAESSLSEARELWAGADEDAPEIQELASLLA